MTWVATVFGWIAIALGVLRTGLAIFLITTSDELYFPRYLGTQTTGEAINRGMVYAVIGLGLILLARIARNTDLSRS